MKPADADRQAGGTERLRQIDGARELVGLDPDEAYQGTTAGLPDAADDPLGPHAPDGLVIGLDADLDLVAKHMPAPGVLGETAQTGERIRRDRRPEPLDRITVVVVMRRLDQHEVEQGRTGSTGHRSVDGSITARSRPAQLTARASPPPHVFGRSAAYDRSRVGGIRKLAYRFVPLRSATLRCSIIDCRRAKWEARLNGVHEIG